MLSRMRADCCRAWRAQVPSSLSLAAQAHAFFFSLVASRLRGDGVLSSRRRRSFYALPRALSLSLPLMTLPFSRIYAHEQAAARQQRQSVCGENEEERRSEYLAGNSSSSACCAFCLGARYWPCARLEFYVFGAQTRRRYLGTPNTSQLPDSSGPR